MAEQKFDVRDRHLIVVASGAGAPTAGWLPLDVARPVAVWEDWLTDPALDDRRFDVFDERLAQSPTRAVVEAALRDTHRISAPDAVVLYVIGHGEVIDNAHRLVLAGSDRGKPLRTMQATAEVLGWLRESGVENALVVIDTCFAGKAAEQLLQLDRSLPKSWLVIASTTPTSQAWAGQLTDGLANFLSEVTLGEKWASPQPYLNTNDLYQFLSEQLKDRGQDLVVLGQYVGPTPCLPNPGYRPDENGGVATSPARSELALLRDELQSHWSPRSRGVGAEDDQGWLFSGRDRLMSRLADAAVATTGGAWVVTGPAGCGKSAVLSRLVTLSDPVFLAEHATYLDSVSNDVRPRVDAVDVAVLATGRTAGEVVERIHHALLGTAVPGLESLGPAARQGVLLARLRDRMTSGPPVCVVVDAVDEATEPVALVDALTELRGGEENRLNLIVGIRSPRGDLDRTSGLSHPEADPLLAERAVRQLNAESLPADQAPYWRDEDLVDYLDTLLRTGPGRAASAYAADPGRSRAVASTLAQLVGSSYLLGRIVAQDLAARQGVQDPADESWRGMVQGGLASLLSQELANSFPDESERSGVLAVLRATALSFGRGIPWRRIWPALATAVSGGRTTYGDSDIARVLGHRISGYLVRNVENGMPVYRPFHFALRDALLEPWDDVMVRAAHGRVAMALAALAAPVEFGMHLVEPEPYLRRHVLDHAAAAGALDEALHDLDVLVTADAVALSTVAAQSRTTLDSTTRTAILSAVAHVVADTPLPERAAQLAAVALRYGAPHLVPRGWEHRGNPAWWPLWATETSEPPFRQLSPPGQPVHVVATAPDESLHAFVGEERAADLVSLLTGDSLPGWPTEQYVRAAAACGPYVVLVAGGIHVCDIRTAGRPIASLAGGAGDVRSVAVQLDGDRTLIIVVAYYGPRRQLEAYRLRLDPSPEWTRLWELLPFDMGARSLAFLGPGHENRLLAVGDAGLGRRGEGTLAVVVEAATGAVVASLDSSLGKIGHGAPSVETGARAYVSTYDTLLRWDWDSGGMVQQNHHDNTYDPIVACMVDGTELLIRCRLEGIDVLEAATFRDVGGANEPVKSLSVGRIGAETVVVGGGTGGAKLWWLSDLASGQRPARTAYGLPAISAPGTVIGVHTEDRGWLLMDARTGQVTATIRRSDLAGWSHVHLTEDRLVLASRDGRIAAVALEAPFPLILPPTRVCDDEVLRFAATEELLFLGTSHGVVHILDVHTGAAACRPLLTRLGGTDYVTALTVSNPVEGRRRLIIGMRKYEVVAYWIDELLADDREVSQTMLVFGGDYNSAEDHLLLTGTRNSVDVLAALDTPAGELIVAADSRDNYLINGATILKNPFPAPVIYSACQVGAFLVTAHADLAVRWWSLDDPVVPRLVDTLRLPARPWGVTRAFDDHLLVSMSSGLMMVRLAQ